MKLTMSAHEAFHVKSLGELRRQCAGVPNVLEKAKSYYKDRNILVREQSSSRNYPTLQDEQELLKRFLSEGDKNRRVQQLFIQQYERILDHLMNTAFQHVPISDRNDVRQVGHMTLVATARKFDPQRGVRFSTLVGHRMWQEMSKYATRTKPVTVGREDTEELEKIHALKRKTAKKELEDEKICEILGMNKKRFYDLMMLDQSLDVVSMEHLIKQRDDQGNNQPFGLQEYDSRWTDFEERQEFETALQDIFAHMGLSDRNRSILVMYFGIRDEKIILRALNIPKTS